MTCQMVTMVVMLVELFVPDVQSQGGQPVVSGGQNGQICGLKVSNVSNGPFGVD
jgi:hypothetical protein